jgi:hypothetical protein
MEKMSKRWEDVALGYEGKYFIFVQYRKNTLTMKINLKKY